MKIYRIKVNGKTYKVELEAVEEVKSAAGAAQSAKVEEKKAEAPAPVSSGEGKEIKAPIQGTVSALKVNVGDTVKKGQVVVIIEAMKLENEVNSPFDGVVEKILVSKGSSVASKQPIIVIK